MREIILSFGVFMKKSACIGLLFIVLLSWLLFCAYPLFPKTALNASWKKIVPALLKISPDDKRQLTDAEARNLLWEAEAILTDSIAANPGHRELLTRRSEVYGMLGEIDKMLADVETLIAATGGWPELLMLRCMVHEKKGSLGDDVFTCYAEVCDRYRKKKEPTVVDYLNWAFAELMAGRPENTEILLEESRKTPEFPIDESWNLLMELDGTFDRKNFLENLMPLPTTGKPTTEKAD